MLIRQALIGIFERAGEFLSHRALLIKCVPDGALEAASS